LGVTDEHESYDVVVIGAGPVGENVADYAHRGGLSSALVDHELFGGECSYWACMPSKALLRPIEVLAAARAVPGSAEAAAGGLDVAAVLRRRDSFTHGWDDSSQVAWAEHAGISVVRGTGRITDVRQVEVTAADGSVRLLRARHAVCVSTGTTAAVPPLPGLREAKPWTSRQLTSLREVPPRVAVLGGGVVACEGAQILSGLGARSVTVLERGDRLLGRTERFAGELLARRFAEQGIEVRTGTEAVEVRRPEPGGEVTVVLRGGEELRADELLVALGRVPATSGMGLDSCGLPDGGYLPVDDHLCVQGVPGEWLYATGDVTGKALLTHMGKYQGRVAGDVIAARAQGLSLDGPRYRATSQDNAVTQVVFTSPQVGAVGPTAEQARRDGVRVAVYDVDMGSVAGASLLRDDYHGSARLVVDADAEVVIGATFAGDEVAELVHAATVAVVGRVPLETLWHAVPSYPTVSEIWLRLLEAWRFDG
jgi:dihydrolipoamide dehydrogenase